MRLTSSILAVITIVVSTDASSSEYRAHQPGATSGPVVTNYEAQGNLAVTHELDCIPLASAKSEYTPPDLYNAFAKCVRESSYANATGLFLLAGSYVRFDAKRVADVTAHQARTALIMQYISSLSSQQKSEWNAYSDMFTPDSKELQSACDSIKVIGAPTYYPTYMIQHGIDAFSSDRPEPLVNDLDQSKAWESILNESLHCTI